MPALAFGLLAILTSSFVTRNILKGLAALFAISTFVRAKKYEKAVWAARMNFNVEKAKWEEATGVPPQELAHFHLDREDLPSSLQLWALGDYILYEDEWMQFWEYLEVDAANRTNPGSRWTAINGPWLREIGIRRWNDPEIKSLLYQKETE
jgi:hypothetical protein